MQTAGVDKILNIPSGLSFSDTLVKYLYTRTGGDPLKMSEYLLLLPSRRSCRTVREAFLRRSNGTPNVLPIMRPLGEADAEELSILISGQDNGDVLDIPPAISPLRRQIILARTIVKLYDQILPSQQRPRFDQATMLAAELGRFLDQVQTEKISFDKLADLVPAEFANHWQITLDFLKILTDNWPEILKAYGVIDPAERRNRLLNAQAQVWDSAPPKTPVIAAGTIASIPAARDLLKTIYNLPQGQIIIPGLDKSLDDDAWEVISEDHPQHFLKALLDHLNTKRTDVRDIGNGPSQEIKHKNTLWSEVMRPAETTQSWRFLDDQKISASAIRAVTRIDCATAQEEADVISILLREAIEDPEKTAAVITADRNLALRVMHNMSRWGVMIDDSAGTSLHLTRTGSWALNCAQMVADNFAPISFLTALKHPLSTFRQYAPQKILRNIELSILRGVQGTYGLEYLKARANEAEKLDDTAIEYLDALETAVSPLMDIINKDTSEYPFASLLRAHIKTLENMAATENADGRDRIWQGDDGEALGQFFTEILNLSEDLPNVSFDQYILILRQLISQKTVRPKYGVHPRISILGQMEARLYVADTVILAGLNEGTWPPDTAADPWMSRQMRSEFGLPAHEQTIGIAAHDFVQLVTAPKVFLTRAERSGGGPTKPARWLLRLDTVLSALGLEMQSHMADQYLDWVYKLDLPPTVKPMGRPAPKPPVSARPKKLSVTGVERLMRDPYEVYAKYILKLRALDPIDADPAAAERGQLLHKILEQFVAKYPDTLPDQALGTLLDMGQTAFNSLNLSDEIYSFWWPRFERLAKHYIKAEAEWRADKGMPSATEANGQYKINSDQFDFTVTAIADRIDTLKNNTLGIIDYKTGQPPTAQDIQNGFAPQMWLEALIASKGGFNNIPTSEIGYLGFWTVSGGHPPLQEKQINSAQIAEDIILTEEGLKRVIEAFNNDNTPYYAQPNPDVAPRYSDYLHLERIQEWVFEQDDTKVEVNS